MKAFLLAAGHGTRMRPLTDTIPKCLLPVCGTPMLQIWLDQCRRNGIHEVLINIHAHGNLVRDFIKKFDSGVQLRVSEESVLLGSAGTLLSNRQWLGSDPAFWVFYGDVLTTANLGKMLHLHESRNQLATLGVYEVPDPKRCGIVTLDKENIVQEFVEKPESPSSCLAFAGIMIGSPALIDCIPKRIPADIGFDVLPKLAGRMAAYRISDYLLDIGTPENYQAAQRNWPGFQS